LSRYLYCFFFCGKKEIIQRNNSGGPEGKQNLKKSFKTERKMKIRTRPKKDARTQVPTYMTYTYSTLQQNLQRPEHIPFVLCSK